MVVQESNQLGEMAVRLGSVTIALGRSYRFCIMEVMRAEDFYSFFGEVLQDKKVSYLRSYGGKVVNEQCWFSMNR